MDRLADDDLPRSQTVSQLSCRLRSRTAGRGTPTAAAMPPVRAATVAHPLRVGMPPRRSICTAATLPAAANLTSGRTRGSSQPADRRNTALELRPSWVSHHPRHTCSAGPPTAACQYFALVETFLASSIFPPPKHSNPRRAHSSRRARNQSSSAWRARLLSLAQHGSNRVHVRQFAPARRATRGALRTCQE